jgi:hypothetical protein
MFEKRGFCRTRVKAAAERSTIACSFAKAPVVDALAAEFGGGSECEQAATELPANSSAAKASAIAARFAVRGAKGSRRFCGIAMVVPPSSVKARFWPAGGGDT